MLIDAHVRDCHVQVLKRTVSRCLLLAVCMGFGVVKPKLQRTTTGVLCRGLSVQRGAVVWRHHLRCVSTAYESVSLWLRLEWIRR